jgi:hypothetical protein
MAQKFDFGGWATKNDLLCADGRIIRRNAFKENDGQTVPLVYQHNHNDPTGILGHALLENREDGVYAYCSFNNTMNGQHVKEAVEHGDVVSLSIYANKLVQKGQDVLHGLIREVSVVLAGANPGAYIDNPILVHGEGTTDECYEDVLDEAMIYTGEPIEMYHSYDEDEEYVEYEEDTEESDDADVGADADEEYEDVEEVDDDAEYEDDEEIQHSADDDDDDETNKEEAEMANNEKTVKDVFDELTEEQKKVVYFMIGQALEDAKGGSDDDEGDTNMKHNVFDNDMDYGPVLCHSDELAIITDAKKNGKLKEAMHFFEEENDLQHDSLQPVSGFTSYPSGATPAGVDALFPEWHDVRPGAPEIVTNDQAWVKAVLGKVHRSPFSRIRTSQVDIRNIDDLRAKGYQKGKQKTLVGNYAVAKRTTSPQTVFVHSALNRDDVVDITDFSYVDYQYKIDRMELELELARAILIGDGRDAAAENKINEENIRPIWTDNEIFTIHKILDTTPAANDPGFGEGYRYAQAAEEAILDAKIDYRGSGSMDMFCDQAFFNKMLLAKDLNGRRIYTNKSELLSALDVNNAYNVPEFQNKTRTEGTGSSARTYRLLAIIGNLVDYAMGSTKGGEITHFTDFDIDFNQLKSMLETRVSGANTRLYSFIVIEEEVTNP